MKKIIKKIRSKAGERLFESLAAILIFTMGSIVLLSLCSAASDINMQVRKTEQKIQKELVSVEKADTPREQSVVEMVLNGNVVVHADVDVYGDSTPDALYTYFKHVE